MRKRLPSETRVLHVGRYFWPRRGGIEQSLYHRCLRYKDHVRLRVLASNTTRRTVRETYDGIDVTRLPLWGTVAGMPVSPELVGELRRTDADIIHFHTPNPVAELACLVAQPKAKIVSLHHHDVRPRKVLWPMYRRVERAFYERNARIIATAPENIEHSTVLRDFKERACVIPSSIDPDEFRRTPERERRVKALRERFGPRMILFIGRHVLHKGLHVLIRAMKDLDAHLVVGSHGPYTMHLKELTRRLGLSERVTFTGDIPDDDVPCYFQAADVFCLPSMSRLEAFGLVQLEAMVCGVPVVSTRLETGVVYVNLDGVTGLTVPPGDAGALAAALGRLLSDEALRRKLGQQARKRVLDEFTHDLNVRRTLELYAEVLEE